MKAVAGIVEIVDMQEEKPFKSLEELLTILNATKVGAVIQVGDEIRHTSLD